MDIVLLVILGILASSSPATAAVPAPLSGLPPSEFSQFKEILSNSVLRGPTSSDIKADLNGFKEWYFGAFEYSLSSRAAVRLATSPQEVIQFAAEGKTMSILQQSNKSSEIRAPLRDELYTPEWRVNSHNGAIAEFFIPEPDSGVDKFTILSFAADGTRIGFDRHIVLMRFEWAREYESDHDVLLLHFRRRPSTGSGETIVIGQRPTEDSPLKVRCEVDHDKVFVKAGDRIIINGTELEGYEGTVFWIRVGVVVYEAEPESVTRVRFSSIEWI